MVQTQRLGRLQPLTHSCPFQKTCNFRLFAFIQQNKSRRDQQIWRYDVDNLPYYEGHVYFSEYRRLCHKTDPAGRQHKPQSLEYTRVHFPNKITNNSDSGVENASSTFILGQEVDEPMPNNITLKVSIKSPSLSGLNNVALLSRARPNSTVIP
jgi:hypothetical protein